MSKLCFGFEVHQPFRLNSQFQPNGAEIADLKESLLSPINKEILVRVAEKCYIPATRSILERLDEGFKCAFSLSGTLIEQLELWNEEALELFKDVAAHKNSEFLCQTYYHSVSSLFCDLSEFEAQVRQHRTLIRDTFGVDPQVMENTEFILNNRIAASAKKLGFKAIYTEGVERVLEWRSPNYVYSCNGIKLLMRNYQLSDDIAFRFNNRSWDQYPLTADKFASWTATVPGDYINIFIDYETFGEHHWKDTGIFEFLEWLPRECLSKGSEFIKPSEAAEIGAREEVSIDETISWADAEKDASAWLGNTIQHKALNAIQASRPYAKDKKLWRYLQTSDHFYYMASKAGSCGEVHNYFSPDSCGTFAAFNTYMKILSYFEERAAPAMRSKKAAMALRTVPPEKAFNFHTPIAYTGFTAYSMDDLGELLNYVPVDSIAYHLHRKDISQWVAEVLGDQKLAVALLGCKNRLELVDTVKREREILWKRLK